MDNKLELLKRLMLLDDREVMEEISSLLEEKEQEEDLRKARENPEKPPPFVSIGFHMHREVDAYLKR